MEKYTKFRDRGTGIAPFIPVNNNYNTLQLPLAICLLLLRLPFLLSLGLCYFLLFQFLPVGPLVHKGALWALLLVSGIWWIDLQVEGVKRGTLSKNTRKLPYPGSIIASTLTSPLDALYLAATFDPIFVLPVYGSSEVRVLSLLQAMWYPLMTPTLRPFPSKETTNMFLLLQEYPRRIFVVFPEATSTNGKALLSFAPCLTPLVGGVNTTDVSIFPVSLRYTPAGVTTPVPQSYINFLWQLLGQASHSMKVRIGDAIQPPLGKGLLATSSSSDTITEKSMSRDRDEKPSNDMKQGDLEESVGEALARIGRLRRVGLGLEDKIDFYHAWRQQRH